MLNISEFTFLVVEDDGFQRFVIVDLLKILGASNVLEASNGSEALQYFKDGAHTFVDIILCDLNMPEMDGMEFFRHLGGLDAGISTIIISAEDSSLIASVKNMVQAYGLKLLGAVEKPVTLKNLQKIISLHTPQNNFEKSPSDGIKFDLDDILKGIQCEQFEPYYQPKMDIASQKIIGAEALARWIHPNHGVVAPYAFIELLEK